MSYLDGVTHEGTSRQTEPVFMGRRNQLSWCVEPQELCWYQRNRRIVKSSRASEMGCSKSSFQGPTTTADCNTRWHLQDSHVRTTAVSLKTFFSYLMRRTLQGRTREASKPRGRQADSSAHKTTRICRKKDQTWIRPIATCSERVELKSRLVATTLSSHT